ncbi:MAG: uroporphyrinogen decarboxylase family protein, partial [Candidatus Kariarchaeaceae archaeon]
FDQTVEAEAMGSEMKVKGDIPAITGHAFKSYEELQTPDNFLEKGRVPVILDAVEILRRTVGDSLPIIAGIVGPFTLSTMIFNPATVIKATITQPKEVSESVSSLVHLLSDYANELSKRGADIIVVEDMFSSQIGPEQFQKIAKEPLKQLIFSIKAPVVLHICGNSTHIFSDMIETGPDGISIEKQTDLTKASELARNNITLIGNIDPVSDLMRGSQNQIEDAVKSAIDGGISLVAPGCSIAPRTTNESIRQMVDYTKQYGKDK